MLLGAPASGSGYIPTKLYEYADYFGAYFQDDIRLTKSLTINLGMRWEREYGLQEKQQAMVVGFDTRRVNPLAANVTGILPKGVIQFAGVNGNKHTRQQSEPEQARAAHRRRLAGEFEDHDPRRLRPVLGAAVRDRHAVQPSGLHRDHDLRRVQRRQRDAREQPDAIRSRPAWRSRPATRWATSPASARASRIIDPNSKSPRVHQFSIDVQRAVAVRRRDGSWLRRIAFHAPDAGHGEHQHQRARIRRCSRRARR